MKRIVQQFVFLVFLLLISIISISTIPAQEQEPPPWLWLGPRLGITGVISKASDFDDIIEEIFPKSRNYFPLYSEIGLAVEQRIRIEGGGYQWFLQERVLVGGLDQTVALPSLSLLLGISTPFGLEIGLGPDFSLESKSGGAVIAPAMVYALAWTFFISDEIKIPVILSAVPIPPEGEARLSLLAGLDFGFRFKREKKKTPFNY
ncbi:MAG: hypothetical protein JSV89_19020 [Spirochaetaceae bacterium]|nr:MAG: hypothetical protein JSV89_19020 [Spirochaetaceae bacterium]